MSKLIIRNERDGDKERNMPKRIVKNESDGDREREMCRNES